MKRYYFGTPAWIIARKRVGWLFLLFVAGTLMGVVTDAFKLVWTQIVALALFVPLIIDTGGIWFHKPSLPSFGLCLSAKFPSRI